MRQLTLHADLHLARRLELTEAEANREACFAAARVRPGCGATAASFMGGWAMFDGQHSPITQCFALGLHGPVSASEMDAVEHFFLSRSAPCAIELCPHADPSLIALLGERGYRVVEYSNVLVREGPFPDSAPPAGLLSIRAVQGGADARAFGEMVLRGFFQGSETPPGLESLLAGAFALARACEALIVTVDGRVAGGGSSSIFNKVLNCYGDATLPEFRGRGIQSTLIAARLAATARAGAQLAMATTMPGTISQRNYERAGFRVVYTRCKFLREWT